jgi:hypothetical protein
MEREDIVRHLLSIGVMATPETLKRIETDGMDIFLSKIGKDSTMVIQDEGGDDGQLSCCVSGPSAKPEMTTEDIVQANDEKFRGIRDLLLRKMDAVSISNIGRSNSKLSVVGMVNESTGQGFVIEDGTGEVEVRSSEKVELDDVIGVRGWIRDKALFADEIVYPDIPINRPVNTIDGKLLLMEDLSNNAEGADIALTPTKLVDKEGNERDIPNPAWISLEMGGKKLTILVYRPQKQASKEEVLSWLKKRYIGTDDLLAPGSERIMKTIPDILWIASANDPWTENYKGVTLISFGNGHQALIDMSNRKTEIK